VPEELATVAHASGAKSEKVPAKLSAKQLREAKAGSALLLGKFGGDKTAAAEAAAAAGAPGAAVHDTDELVLSVLMQRVGGRAAGSHSLLPALK
jgi:hypothetical protein